MAAKFLALSDGSLITASGPMRTVRENYSITHREIRSGQDLRSTLRAGSFVWPGGYPLYFITDDGEELSFDAVRENIREVISAIRRRDSTGGWRVIACDVNWEDSEMVCAHTGQRIESAYGEK